MRHLGGYWRVVAAILWCVPRPIRDALYDGLARIRTRLFARPAEVCPLLPPRLRDRFEA
ncbi:MAG: thiol-disulfide oxidoreductase DCC family protein [Planctomycetota bacterium]